MSGRAWLSNVMRDYRIGDKQGLRAKFYGEDWRPPQHKAVPTSDKVHTAVRKHVKGYALKDEEFPEAIAVFDNKRFSRVGDLFVAGHFYAVKGRLAEVLECFDFGDGGLIPFKIYRDDLKTPIDGSFYYVNFGSIKDTFLPNKSKNVRLISDNKETGIELWQVDTSRESKDVTLSKEALVGADVWMEKKIIYTFFISDILATTLQKEKLNIDLQLSECGIAELSA